MSKLEEAIERLQHNKNMPLHGGESVIVSIDDLETVLEELNKVTEERNTLRKQVNGAFDRGFIPKQYIQEKIEELKKDIEEVEKNILNTTDEEKKYWKKTKHDLVMQKNILEELLEGK